MIGVSSISTNVPDGAGEISSYVGMDTMSPFTTVDGTSGGSSSSVLPILRSLDNGIYGEYGAIYSTSGELMSWLKHALRTGNIPESDSDIVEDDDLLLTNDSFATQYQYQPNKGTTSDTDGFSEYVREVLKDLCLNVEEAYNGSRAEGGVKHRLVVSLRAGCKYGVRFFFEDVKSGAVQDKVHPIPLAFAFGAEAALDTWDSSTRNFAANYNGSSVKDTPEVRVVQVVSHYSTKGV